ncbi:MAG: hypothetical protein AAF141_11390 [Pseudomonadota bacterium]
MEFRHWRLWKIGNAPVELPTQLITRRPFDADGRLDPATALLLPSAGVKTQMDPCEIDLPDADRADTCLGLWMGTGFPVLPKTATSTNMVGWVSNFPTGGMFEERFGESLAEVGLGATREHALLQGLQSRGFKVLVALHAGQKLETIKPLNACAALIVIRSDSDLKKIHEGYLGAVRSTLGETTALVLHGGPERHLPNTPQTLGVDGLLDMPS